MLSPAFSCSNTWEPLLDINFWTVSSDRLELTLSATSDSLSCLASTDSTSFSTRYRSFPNSSTSLAYPSSKTSELNAAEITLGIADTPVPPLRENKSVLSRVKSTSSATSARDSALKLNSFISSNFSTRRSDVASRISSWAILSCSSSKLNSCC